MNPDPKDFTGTQMANFLDQMTKDTRLPLHYRNRAELLKERWDSICSFRLNNPIVNANLEKELFPNG